MLASMELLERYRDYEICRTSAGHIVVLDPLGSAEQRAELTELVATSGSFDSLFFPTVPDARSAVDAFIEHTLRRR